MPKTKILLFGASGFIGHNLLDFWSNQGRFEVIAPTSRHCNLLDQTQTSQFIVATQPDFIINAAHPGVNSNISYSDEYVANTLKIVSHIISGAAKVSHLKKVFMFGSGLEYGDSPKPISEEHALHPKNVYATTKAMTSLLALDLARELKVPLVLLRLFNLYGPYDTKGVGHYLISSILKGQQPHITPGKQVRDFLYVGDVVGYIDDCLQHHSQLENGQIYNLGSGQPTQLLQFSQEIFKQLKFSGPPKYLDYKPNEYWHNVAKVSKIKKILPLKVKTDLTAGIAQTIEWVKRNSV